MKRRSALQFGLLATPAIILARHARAEDSELIVGANAGGPPFSFLQNGAYTGFDVEVWRDIAKGLGRKWRLQSMEFDALIPGLQTRNIDVIVSQLFITPQRQQVIDFSTPYYTSGLIAITRAGNTTIQSSADLVGKSIGTETGTTSVDYINNHIKNATLVQLPTINDALLALQAGRTDAVVYDTPVLLYYARTAGKGLVRVVRPSLQGRDVGIGFRKGSPLVAPVNAQLAAMKADGRLKALDAQWFGSDSN